MTLFIEPLVYMREMFSLCLPFALLPGMLLYTLE